MTVNFNGASSVFTSFKSGILSGHQSSVVSEPQTSISKTDTVYITGKKKKNFKERVMDINKFFINLKNLTIGSAKGILHGTVAGVTTLGLVAARNIIKKAPKIVGVKGKLLAGAVGLTVMAVDIIKSKLNANEQSSKIDHRWKTGHNGE